MQLDIATLAVISGITFLTQVIALTIQHRANPKDESLSWWLLGAVFWTLGALLMPLVLAPRLLIFARLGNPFVVLGTVFLYVGLCHFLKQPDHRWPLAGVISAAIAAYGFWIDVQPSLSARTVLLAAIMAAVILQIAFKLLRQPDRRLRTSAAFTGLAFAAYGLFLAARAVIVALAPPLASYTDPDLMLPSAFVVSLLCSLLWTFGFIIMVNQRLNAENVESKDRLQLIFNTIPDAAIITRLADSQVVDVNTAFLAMNGHTRADVIGRTTLEIGLWDQPAERTRLVAELTAHGTTSNFEAVVRRRDGSPWTGLLSSSMFSIDGLPHAISLIRDITDQKNREAALHDSEMLYRSILNASPDNITITDMQAHILVSSPMARRMLGYDPTSDRYASGPITDYLLPEDRPRAEANLRHLVAEGRSGPNEYRALRKDGSTIDVEVNAALILGAHQLPTKMVFVVRDVTERKRSDQHIRHLMRQLEAEKRTAQLNANTDSLTGLPNRRFFDAALKAAFYSARRLGQPLSLIMLDVDHFKKFNDLYGHLAGDDCLRQIGSALKAVGGRTNDLLARYGGEEFVALLPDTEPAGALALAERLRLAVAELGVIHAASDTAPYVTISVGVATTWPAEGEAAGALVSLADEALYTAKREGRNRTVVAAAQPQPVALA